MEAERAPSGAAGKVAVRPLREDELDEADRIVRLAFGTFLGLPDPLAFMGDAGFVRTRWRADPAAAFAAEVGGELVGSNFAANWGSFGFFGPLTVRPDLWDRGVARRLLEPTMALFERWGTRHVGLFTFPQSPKHLGLYQAFGFWPRFLTPVMSKAVGGRRDAAGWSGYSAVPEREREGYLGACRELTDAIYGGLDLTGEIRAVQAQGLGETVLVGGGERLDGFAVCHCGPGTEAGGGACFVKFGAARPGRARGRPSSGCWTPARGWPPPAASRGSWPGSTPPAGRRIAGCWRAASAPTWWGWRWSGRTSRATTAQTSTSWTIGAEPAGLAKTSRTHGPITRNRLPYLEPVLGAVAQEAPHPTTHAARSQPLPAGDAEAGPAPRTRALW